MCESNYKFRLPIGDWAGDGHEKCNYYTVASNKPIEIVREAHFNIRSVTGIDMETICSCYEEDSILPELLDVLKGMGFEPSNCFGDETILSADDMANLWIFMLMQADPTLELAIMEEEEIPMLPFHGQDSKGRHIGSVGYGVLR